MKQHITPPKQLNLELLRVIASIGVVVIHVSTQIVVLALPISLSSWLSATIFNSFFRWTVPVFLMISGFIFLEEKKPSNKPMIEYVIAFWKKRVPRLFWPLCFWVLFYIVVHHVLRHDPLTVQFISHRLLFDQPYEHLYFLFILFFLALATPMVQKIHWQLSQKQRNVLNIVLAGLCFLFPPNRMLLFFWIPYAGYFFLGAVIPNITQALKIKLSSLFVLFFSTVLLTICAVMKKTLFEQTTVDLLSAINYFSPYVISMSCLVFSIATHEQFKERVDGLKESSKKLILKLSDASLGIYLFHVSLIAVVLSQKKLVDFILRHGGVVTVLGTILIYGVSFWLISYLRKLKFFRVVT